MRKSIGLWQVLPLIPCPWPTACWSDSGAKHGAVQMKKVSNSAAQGLGKSPVRSVSWNQPKGLGMLGMAHGQDIKKDNVSVSTFQNNCPKYIYIYIYLAFCIYMGFNMSRSIGRWMAMVQQVRLVLSGSHWSCIRLEHSSSLRRKCGRGTFQLYLGGGFKHFLFSPLFGEDSQFD